MSAIHELQTVAPLPEFDVFSVPPIQTTVTDAIISEHRPISILGSTNFIEFHVPSGQDEYIQFRETLFYLKIRIILTKTDRSDVTDNDWNNVSPINNLLHSMIKNISLEIGNKQMVVAPQTYPYRAYIETLLGYTKDARESHLGGALWLEDKLDGVDSKKSDWIKTNTDPKEKAFGRELDLMGKLFLDIAYQGRATLGGVDCTFKFNLNDPSFYLMAGPGILPRLEILESKLYVHKSKVSPMILEAHSRALQVSRAKYPITRSEVKAFTVAKDKYDEHVYNVFIGQLPRRVFIFMVDNGAFIGDLKKNPFKLEHFKINEISCSVDGVLYPPTPYKPNFVKNNYVEVYQRFIQAANELGSDCRININRTKYAQGYTIFGFNFAPDLSDGCGMVGHLNPIKRGSLHVNLKFAERLAQAISLLVYGEFDNLIEIDSERNVHTDYN